MRAGGSSTRWPTPCRPNAPADDVVFDASVPPGDFPLVSTYRGICGSSSPWATRTPTPGSSRSSAHDSNPKTLTVVSSDRRIRQAASRRRARPLTAEQFWDRIDDLAVPAAPERPKVDPTGSGRRPRRRHESADEAAFWLEIFRDAG